MAKGYWIVRVNISDPEAYKAYLAANGTAFRKFGARFIVRGGDCVQKEGEAKTRNVIIEFKDFDTALACYESPEYAQALALRRPASQADVTIIHGYDGPQPGDPA